MPETSPAGLVALPDSAADSGHLPARRVLPRPDRREIAAIFAGGAAGLCGGLSTFSTMQVEIFKMLEAHAWGLAAGYAAASIAAGYAAIHLATALVRRVRLVLSLLTGLALGHDQALLAGTAAAGSYTTFSTWMLETQRLAEERQFRKVAFNVAASLILGVAAAAFGYLIRMYL